MPTSDEVALRRVLLWTAACLTALAFTVALLVVRLPEEPVQEEASTTATTRLAHPLRVEETLPLTVPATLRTDTHRFEVEDGKSYLLSFEVSATKPVQTPGTAMYLGVSLACTGGGDAEVRSISGTQNILDGKPVTLTNQFLLVADGGGERACNLMVSSANESAAAVGARVDVELIWEAVRVGSEVASFPTDDRLPVVVPVGGRQAAFRETLPVPEEPGTRFTIRSSLHVTSCTIVNGSREGGEPLCTASDTDDGGSSFDTDLRVDVLDSRGDVCQRLPIFDDSVHVDKKTHHQLLSFAKSAELPEKLCGDSLEFVLAVSNGGPAPLLVHGNSSSFIVVAEEL